MPDAAPVTTATLPEKSLLMADSFLLGLGLANAIETYP
jgi:hypothetical protein